MICKYFTVCVLSIFFAENEKNKKIVFNFWTIDVRQLWSLNNYKNCVYVCNVAFPRRAMALRHVVCSMRLTLQPGRAFVCYSMRIFNQNGRLPCAPFVLILVYGVFFFLVLFDIISVDRRSSRDNGQILRLRSNSPVKLSCKLASMVF